MLTFFRRIRKDLFTEGAIPRYFFYAIGEIALVVVGILIALQINTWNEQRKSNRMEHSYLENLKVDLENLNKIDYY